MFPAKTRLGRADFTQFFKTGRRFQTAALTLVYLPSPTLHVSVVVGKKVSKLAVGRNRIRRRLYAGLRRFFEANGITSGVYIIIAKPVAVRYSRVELASELTTLLALPQKPR